MVKPALPYLDVIRAIREAVDVPVVAYQVSGEFAMLHAAADRGWMDLRAARCWKPAIALRRAGADLLITYFAPRDRDQAARSARPRGTAAGGPAMSDALSRRAPGSIARVRVTPGGVHSPVRAFTGRGRRPARHRRGARRARRRRRQAAATSTGSAPGDRRFSAMRIRASERAVVDAARHGLVFGLRLSARGRPRRAHCRARARLRDGPLRRLRHRSDDERGARGARRHRARRRSSSSPARITATPTCSWSAPARAPPRSACPILPASPPAPPATP